MNTSPLKRTILGVCIAVMALSISVPLQAKRRSSRSKSSSAADKKKIEKVRARLRKGTMVKYIKDYRIFLAANRHGKSSYIAHIFGKDSSKGKRLAYAYTLFKQFSENSNSRIRRVGLASIYHLSNSDFPKNSIFNKILYNKWLKDIRKAVKSEKDRTAKRYLQRLEKKIKALSKS